MKIPSALVRLKERVEPAVRTFEWTWTTATIASLAIIFFLMISMAVIPSFWLYFADQELGWDGSGPNGFWLMQARDAVAMGLTTGPFVTALVAATAAQNWRRKLRGETGDSRPSGGYR